MSAAGSARVLAQLIAQGTDGGADLATLRAIAEEAGELAATRALTRLGLSGLWRARRGMTGPHAAGERFVLIEPDSAVTLPVDAAPGGSVRVMASGVGDGDVPVETTASVTGASLLPPAPVRLAREALPGGGVIIRWRRRSRAGWGWRDGADAPLGEEREAYRVTIAPAAVALRTIEVTAAAVEISAADRASGAVVVSVRQIGTNGLSPPAAITV